MRKFDLAFRSSISSYIATCPHQLSFSSRSRHTRSLRDWSSDVCTSDLPGRALSRVDDEEDDVGLVDGHQHLTRSEERRVGKECRSRWSPDQYKKKE